jgi:hypothetical protein
VRGEEGGRRDANNNVSSDAYRVGFLLADGLQVLDERLEQRLVELVRQQVDVSPLLHQRIGFALFRVPRVAAGKRRVLRPTRSANRVQ